jgi:hypothetical protein
MTTKIVGTQILQDDKGNIKLVAGDEETTLPHVTIHFVAMGNNYQEYELTRPLMGQEKPEEALEAFSKTVDAFIKAMKQTGQDWATIPSSVAYEFKCTVGLTTVHSKQSLGEAP